MNENENLKEKYNELVSKYHSIVGTIKGFFEDRLAKNNIGNTRVTWRIKTWESFEEKIRRKHYKSPFDDIIDICGFRIIAANSDDLDKIEDIISEFFDVFESSDKNADLNPDQFGYRSRHMIFKLKDAWTAVYPYTECKDLKIEIQIRSELMDAWANISHLIFYKKEPPPPNVTRKLHRLAALMEIGDSEISQLFPNQPHTQEMKALQNLLNKFFPDRPKPHAKLLFTLTKEMEAYNFPLEVLKEIFTTEKSELLRIEKEAFAKVPDLPFIGKSWWQDGIVRGVMFLTNDEYWNNEGKHYAEHFVSAIEANRINFFKRGKNEN